MLTDEDVAELIKTLEPDASTGWLVLSAKVQKRQSENAVSALRELQHYRVVFPDLLAACEALYAHTKNNMQICGINEEARQAIAKAKGEA